MMNNSEKRKYYSVKGWNVLYEEEEFKKMLEIEIEEECDGEDEATREAFKRELLDKIEEFDAEEIDKVAEERRKITNQMLNDWTEFLAAFEG